MTLPDAHWILNATLIVLGVAVSWAVLRVVLRFTAKLFTLGCLALAIGGALIWIVGRLR
jgi:Cu/Ag efflux pump CusA